MDTEILAILETIVNDYVNSRRLFTAYDVTLAARARTRKNVAHYLAKEQVHQLMNLHLSNRTYLRDLINVGSGEQPNLYYPRGEDPSSYANMQTAGRFPAIANLAPPPLADARRQDLRGRITVPASLIRDIGLRHGQIAYVTAIRNRITVRADAPDPYTACYTVDRDDNTRISSAVVETAHLENKTYTFQVSNNSIVITGV